jgi:signal peptidase II
LKNIKGRTVALLILLLLVIDQAVKIFIKTSFYYGEEHKVFEWFRLHFIENPGMAWGWKLGEGNAGKLILTLLRLTAVIWGSFYLHKIIRKKYHQGFIYCVAFIYAGAFGNLIDSMFYGLIFEKSDPALQNVAQAFPSGGGYTGFLFGSVVDMLYFPIMDIRLPEWWPVSGGKSFEFFSPVFNIADVWVSVGVIGLLVFQKRFFAGRKDSGE